VYQFEETLHLELVRPDRCVDKDLGIIADDNGTDASRRLFWAVFAIAALAGALAAWYYAREGLTLTHYDARAHLVVARRVADSLTPGWRQFGAVWLPLPHLVNFVPVQWDWAYRTGGSAVALSIAILSWGLASLARYLRRTTGSTGAAVSGPAAILLNPNVLYLQSTPMTEPILIGFALVAMDRIDRYLRRTGGEAGAAWALTALVMTRYEGWLIAAALLCVTAFARMREGRRIAPLLWQLPFVAIGLFFVLSWASTGVWFVSSGFFVPDSELLHNLENVLRHLREGVRDLTGRVPVWTAAAGLMVALFMAKRRPAALLPLALGCAIGLPLMAFYQGHPFRIRYLVPMIVAASALAALAIGALPRRAQMLVAVLFVGCVWWNRPPLDRGAPMIIEAQRESPMRAGREAVTTQLLRRGDHSPILASMGSLGHYMQETAHAGFDLRDFLHEGNGDLWTEALKQPRLSVRWILMEEMAEGGDALAQRARTDPTFLDGFERIAEGGGLVLYGRRNR
jgi:hypothetical protein